MLENFLRRGHLGRVSRLCLRGACDACAATETSCACVHHERDLTEAFLKGTAALEKSRSCQCFCGHDHETAGYGEWLYDLEDAYKTSFPSRYGI